MSKICIMFWFLFCAILTVWCSYVFSDGILSLFDSIFDTRIGGFFGNMAECLLACILGLLGFLIAFYFNNLMSDPYWHSSINAFIGTAGACAVILVVHIWGVIEVYVL